MRLRCLLLTTLSALLTTAGSAHADTFLLEDGRRIVGDKDGEFRTPSRIAYVRVKTLFGTVSFPKAELKKTLRAGRAKDGLKVESVVVTTLRGTVEKRAADGDAWQPISPRERETGTIDSPRINAPNGVVAPGDTIRTGEDGEADLDIGWGVVHVAAGSELTFVQDGDASLRLTKGRAGARLPDLPRRATFRVETPQASMGVRGTTFAVSVDGDASRVAVEEGEVAVGELSVRGGAAALAGTDAPAASVEVTPDERAMFERLRRTYAIPRLRRVRVPADTFDFGPTVPEPGQPDDRPTVSVAMHAFDIGRTEVTVAELRAFLDFMKAHDDHTFCHPAEPEGFVHDAFLGEDGRAFDRRLAEQPELFDADDQPALGVDFFTAYAFAAWVGGRLPSEVEWIYAALGGSKERFPWGRSQDDAVDHAWCADNAAESPLGPATEDDEDTKVAAGVRTKPVGSLAANGFGLFDMVGNVFEHVDSGWPANPAVAPVNGSSRLPPPFPELRDGLRAAFGGSVATRVRETSAWLMRVDRKEKHTWDVGLRVVWD